MTVTVTLDSGSAAAAWDSLVMSLCHIADEAPFAGRAELAASRIAALAALARAGARGVWASDLRDTVAPRIAALAAISPRDGRDALQAGMDALTAALAG